VGHRFRPFFDGGHSPPSTIIEIDNGRNDEQGRPRNLAENVHKS